MSETWRLHRGDELIAELEVTESDFPWLYATLHSRPGFEAVRPLFTEEAHLVEGEDQIGAWEEAYRTIRETVSLRYPDGGTVPEFILHIDGDEAWWRWSDEPFEE